MVAGFSVAAIAMGVFHSVAAGCLGVGIQGRSLIQHPNAVGHVCRRCFGLGSGLVTGLSRSSPQGAEGHHAKNHDQRQSQRQASSENVVHFVTFLSFHWDSAQREGNLRALFWVYFTSVHCSTRKSAHQQQNGYNCQLAAKIWLLQQKRRLYSRRFCGIFVYFETM